MPAPIICSFCSASRCSTPYIESGCASICSASHAWFFTATSTAVMIFWISRFTTFSSLFARCSTSSRIPFRAYQYWIAAVSSISTAAVMRIARLDFDCKDLSQLFELSSSIRWYLKFQVSKAQAPLQKFQVSKAQAPFQVSKFRNPLKSFKSLIQAYVFGGKITN